MKICYIGIYKPTIARNSVLLSGLKRKRVEVIECIDGSKGFKKYLNLTRKYWRLQKDIDVALVGFTSGILVPIIRIISKRPVIFNASHSMYEGIIVDRKFYHPISFAALRIWLIDFFSFHMSNLVLVETKEQEKFINSFFHVPLRKMRVLFTGAEEFFHPDHNIKKNRQFTVVFRGAFLPATGVEYIINAARILRNDGIIFQLLGRGPTEQMLKKMIDDYDLKNVVINTEFLPAEELRRCLLSSHIMLGQFSLNKRVDRTIQNKTFEALALGMPYITSESKSNLELLTDRENCLFVRPGDIEDLVRAIMELKNDPILCEFLGKKARELYLQTGTSELIGTRLLNFAQSLLKTSS